MTTRARLILGALAFEVPGILRSMLRGGEAYLAICNRHERLEPAPEGQGYRCLWKWTSNLHAALVFPALGRYLLRRATTFHPIERSECPQDAQELAPQVSFLIGHRGTSRLPHLLATLQTIAAQQDARVECIVVEQDTQSHLRGQLPSWVRLIHTPPPDASMPFCRSWAFNVAARYARAEVLVLHDNDMMIPVDYAAQVLSRFRAGYQVANLKRFVFYLTETHSKQLLEGQAAIAGWAPEAVVQNLEGGGSLAIDSASFDRIGGMDESFIGWGGEDNEVWERASALRVWPYANLPIVHLWHPSQVGKQDPDYATARRYRELSEIAPAERTRRLKAMARGRAEGPNNEYTPDSTARPNA